ncbi:TPA: hypothetical protein N0F65_009986 [Lagenidium giganteum]|uniref:Nucleolar protein 6 n=1 Tax=Lagenidium giganteum TaxID=4803 RepID=A0AAV2ZEL4_9STRA|nr:TPA: hypothetical protein N0F65_009986 [Lagenidium giganteum]
MVATKASTFQAAVSGLPAAVAAELTPDLDASQIRKVLSKYALPSANELRLLHAADPNNTYRSSFFRLQVDELLENVQHKPSAKWTTGLQKTLFQVKNILEAIGDQQVTQEALQAKGLCVRNRIKRKEIVLPFKKPSRMDVIGSFILKNMAFARKSASSEYGVFTVDIAVEMPAECFLPKDFMNYRYFDKRNLYLGVLAAEMQSHSQVFDKVHLTGFRSEFEKPIAVLHVNPTYLAEHYIKANSVQVRLIPVITPDVFKLVKLAPTRCNIRHDPSMTEEEMQNCTTPMYNNSILEDMMIRRHTKDLHAVLTENPQFAEACVLAKVWVCQRGFHKTTDSLNGFLISMVLLYLWSKKRVNAQATSEQIFKVLIQFLASHDLEHEPLQLPPSDGGVVLTSEGIQTFKKSFEVVFTDSSGRLNLFGRVTKSAWCEVQHAAKDSMKWIQNGTMEDFRMLFIKKNEFWTRYDQYFWFPCPSIVDDADDDTYTVKEKQEINDMGLEVFWMRKLQRLIARALTDRVDHVRPVLELSEDWTLNELPSPALRKVAIGLRINPDNVSRIVDKGPSTDDVDASAEFRRFWKNQSELRRFKDGAIVEAVVWEGVSVENRHRLLEIIVQYITKAHCPQLTSSDMIKTSNASLYSALEVEETLAVSKSTKGSSSYVSTLNAVSELWIVFNNFAKKLRGLDSLPLKVADVLPVHPGFRYTSLYPVQPHPLAYSRGEKMGATPVSQVNTVLEPLVMHLKFERSSSWPNEMEALRHAKTGFYVHIGHELETHHGLRCEVGMDCVDVFLSGYVFRLVIQSEKEMSILTGGGAKTLAISNSPEFVVMKRVNEYLPKHASNIHALHSKNTSFGPTVRLVQRWLADKHMSNVVTLEAIELLVAFTYINSSSSSMPHSILSGFLRVLKLLAAFDWQHEPLIVDLNGALHDDAKQREVLKRFEASSISPTTHPAMFIVADYEDFECLSSWTRSNPDKVIVQRLVSLAQVSYDALTQWLRNGAATSGWKSAFASSSSEFDALLIVEAHRLPSKRMKQNHVTKKLPFAAPVFKNMDLTTVPVMVGFDPISDLLEILQKKFGHVAYFFHNAIQPDSIYITWKPQAFVPAKFRAITSNYLVCLPKLSSAVADSGANAEREEDANVRSYAVPNIFEVTSEIRELGQGIVTDIKLSPFSAN